MIINTDTFTPIRNTFNANDLKNILNDYFIDQRISNIFNFKNISSIDNIRDNSILFIKGNADIFIKKKDFHIVTDSSDLFDNKKFTNITKVSDLNISNIKLINHLLFHEDQIDFFDDFDYVNNSFISKLAKIDTSSKIGKNCIIGRGVIIGKNCIIKNNVTIKNSILANNIIISDNSVLGSSGFGFDLKNMGATNLIPQIGLVLIKDNVFIGSNCSIDRGKIDHTIIGENSMLDNLIHIAHNVVIGKNTCIAAQTGISGSVSFGDNVIIGGQAGFAGHIKIGKNVIVAARSGVTKNIRDNSTIAGFPAIDIKEWKKQIINQKKNGYK
jgi:UDP-3-O-[3-hydroxymyristoyl] glucosamine N-acyltransferase